VRDTLHIETETPESRIRAGHIGTKKGGDSDTFDLLNSFFLKELARLSGEVTISAAQTHEFIHGVSGGHIVDPWVHSAILYKRIVCGF
ncbi:MAG: hypothetical protein ACYCS8_19210, partial [Acidithiobacillus sp.]